MDQATEYRIWELVPELDESILASKEAIAEAYRHDMELFEKNQVPMPNEDEIIDALVEHFGRPRAVVVNWLLSLDELLLKMAVQA